MEKINKRILTEIIVGMCYQLKLFSDWLFNEKNCVDIRCVWFFESNFYKRTSIKLIKGLYKKLKEKQCLG
jgi:hypothetical protein